MNDPRTQPAAPAPGVWEVVLPLIRPYRWFLAAAASLNALHGFAITFQIFAAVWLVDWVLRHENPPWLLQQVISLLGLPDRLSVRLATLAIVYVLVSVFGRMLTWHFGYRIFTWVRERVLTDLREQFFRQVNHLCLRFHIKRSSGELFSYLFGSPLG